MNSSSTPQSHGSISSTGAISVCHLIASNFAGGPEKQIVELSTRLQAQGWPVAIGSFRENRSEVEVIEVAKARSLSTFLLETQSPFSPGAIGQLRRQLADRSAHILSSHGYKANLIGRLAILGTDVKQLPFVRGFTASDWKIRLYEALDRRVLAASTDAVCVSNATREILVGHGLNRDRIHVLHNAVHCDRNVQTLDLAHEFSLPPDSKILVAAGRLSIEKGHRYLVEAMDLLAQRDPGLRLVILGSGSEQAALENLIEELGLKERVVLGGFRTDVLRCIASAHLVVNPSLTEGLPNVVLEAMSVATPVVATDVGGVSELISNDETGWLIDASSPEALAEAVASAMSDDSGRRRVGEAGQRFVEEHFSFTQQTRKFIELCHRVHGGVSRS